MANISFRDFSLSQTTITGRRTPNVTVDAVHERYNTCNPLARFIECFSHNYRTIIYHHCSGNVVVLLVL